MLQSGILLLFVAPGLAAYCALYGLFHNGKSIAPEPPAANAIETIVIIASAALISHGATATIFALNIAWCKAGLPALPAVSPGWFDPYRSAFTAMSGRGMGTSGTSAVLLGVLGQSGLVFWLCRCWLAQRARKDTLPAWIYGWATDLANSLDNSDTAVVAYVLTTKDIGDETVAYGGLLNDIKLDANGCVKRLTLQQCERYLVDLKADFEKASLSMPLSRFTFMSIDGEHIRNVTFETFQIEEPSL